MSVREHPATWLDVFAEGPLGGNLHLVVHDADDISDEVMARFSARTRLAETSFLQAAPDPGATYRHRIFVPGIEVPFAGHPSLGAAAAHAWRTGQRTGALVQQTLSGLQRLTFELGELSGRVEIEQNPPQFGTQLDGRELMAVAGLPNDAAHPTLASQWVSTGMPTLVAPLRRAEELIKVAFDAAAFARLLGSWGQAPAYNCYIVAEEEPGRWGARCYGEDPSTGEDAATGSAAGPLGAYLNHHLGLRQVVVEQGREMGSPSRLTVDMADGIRVSGMVHLLGTGTLRLPIGQ